MMADIEKLDLSGRRRRRSVIRGSITGLGDKISELEAKEMLSPVKRHSIKGDTTTIRQGRRTIQAFPLRNR